MSIKKTGLTELIVSAVLVAVMLFAATQHSGLDGIPHINIKSPVKSDSQTISDFLI